MFKNRTKPTFSYAAFVASTILSVREGEGEGDGNISMSKADFEKAIADAVALQVGGLKAKNEELLGSVHKLKEASKAFDGLDIEKLRSMQDRLEKDEDARLISEGKTSELIDKYTQRMRADHDGQIKSLSDQIAEANARADKYKGSVLESQILSVTQGLHKGAVEDALLAARNIFTLDAEGRAVKLGPNGQPELGRDGKTPFGPSEWMELQKEAKPHWFPATTSGSGSSGAREASGNGKTITRSKFEALPASERATVAMSGVQIVD
jgi:hypothetical protein